MAKFDPEHATVPDTNFGDRNSAERFLECGKFRQCANLMLPLPEQTSPSVHVYIPICAESRFERTGVAQFMPMPTVRNGRSGQVNPVTYTTVAQWAPLISCPRKCEGYRNKRWANLKHALRSMFRGRQSGLPGTARESTPNDGPLTKAFSNGWVQGLGVTSIAALVGLLVAIQLHTGVEAVAITLAASAIAAALVFVMAVVRYWDSRW